MSFLSKTASASSICLKEENKSFWRYKKLLHFQKLSNLAQNLLSPPNGFSEKVASYYDNMKLKDLNFEFSEACPEKILNIWKSLNPFKAFGIGNLSGKFLKNGAKIFARAISQLCNLSIKLSSFPRSFKIAKVRPHSKKGSKIDPPNYCPISLLPILSKITERIIRCQTRIFMLKQNSP